MNEHLRERILRKLDTLADERGYQVLDYVEFLESRYAERAAPSASAFTRFTEVVEDRLRAGKVSATTIAEAMNLMNRATTVLNGALAAGRSVANDIVTAARPTGNAGPAPTSTTTTSAPSSASAGTNTPASTSAGSTASSAAPRSATADEMVNGFGAADASSTAHDIQMPGSGEEKL